MNKIIYTGLCALTALTFASQLEAKDKKPAAFLIEREQPQLDLKHFVPELKIKEYKPTYFLIKREEPHLDLKHFVPELKIKDNKPAFSPTAQVVPQQYFIYYTGIGKDGSFGTIDTSANKILTYCQYLNQKTKDVISFNQHLKVREVCATTYLGKSICPDEIRYSLQQEKDLKEMYAKQCQQN